MTEKSVFFIKPEAIEHRGKIVEIIERDGLIVEARREILLDMKTLKAIYSHVPAGPFTRMCQDMLNRICPAGMVRGEDAVRRLVEICGQRTVAKANRKDTIRFQFGSSKKEEGLHRNAIHRASTEEEAARQIALFGFDEVH